LQATEAQLFCFITNASHCGIFIVISIEVVNARRIVLKILK
jgi:hypothetical protein